MLNGHYYYHGHIRRALQIFATIFNDMSIAKYSQDGTPVSIVHPIPIKFANEDSFLALNAGKANVKSYNNVTDGFNDYYPRMTFSLDSIQYDTTRKLNSQGVIRIKQKDGTTKFYNTSLPYKLNLTLNIITKNLFDNFQIFEQIVPYFDPFISVSIKDYPATGCVFDMPISLISSGFEDNFEDSIENNREIVSRLEFSLNMNFYGPSGSAVEYDAQKLFINQFVEEHDLCDLEADLDNDIDNMKNKVSPERWNRIQELKKMQYTLSQIDTNQEIRKICLDFTVADGQLTLNDNGGTPILTEDGYISEVDNNVYEYSPDKVHERKVLDENGKLVRTEREDL